MSVERLGLSHVLPPETRIVHSAIIGMSCLGRINDVLSAWCRREHGFDGAKLSDLRMLFQGLLEFATRQNDDAVGNVELARVENYIVIAARFACQMSLEGKSVAKELSQFWVNSTSAKFLKRMLDPADRVEVRYHEALKLIEWRVWRALEPIESQIDHSQSFKVLSDATPELVSGEARYQDLGDLPFADWLAEVYKNTKTGTRAGNIIVESGESQDQEEWARIVVARETESIDQDLQEILQPSMPAFDDEFIRKFVRDNYEPSEEVARARAALSDDEIEKILAENKNLKDAVKELSQRIKRMEFASDREKVLYQQKSAQLETLLRKKEIINQKTQAELRALIQRQAEEHKQSDAVRNDHFRNKALEMYTALKKVKDDNKILERQVSGLKKREVAQETLVEMLAPSSANAGSTKQIDELNKKLERNQRALDAEKAKVKTLSERVMVAEKEAQSSGPIIEDLESKIEHTLKVVQQHKKETEQVKLKLVQADAEKNRVMNDLVKANAQIQTLMKRQAS